MNDIARQLHVRSFGICQYEPVWRAMQQFTSARTVETIDELWCLQHFPVYTQGQAGKAEHILRAGSIPIVQIDRGGQVTYHGPGQLMVYTLVDLARRGLGVRDFVTSLEQSVIDLLSQFSVTAQRKKNAPGVYVEDAKIAALGLRVRHGRTFHGVSINVDMDLTPFAGINPCGYAGMAVTQLSSLSEQCAIDVVQARFVDHFTRHLGYTRVAYDNPTSTPT